MEGVWFFRSVRGAQWCCGLSQCTMNHLATLRLSVARHQNEWSLLLASLSGTHIAYFFLLCKLFLSVKMQYRIRRSSTTELWTDLVMQTTYEWKQIELLSFTCIVYLYKVDGHSAAVLCQLLPWTVYYPIKILLSPSSQLTLCHWSVLQLVCSLRQGGWIAWIEGQPFATLSEKNTTNEIGCTCNA